VTKTDIKYCVEEFKPEGFEISISKNREILCFPDGQWTYLDYPNELFQVMIFQLFLQRVIEGMNNLYINYHGMANVEQYPNGLSIYGVFHKFVKYSSFEDVTTAKEKAIEYIIDQLRVNK